jgi:hypothetical protein
MVKKQLNMPRGKGLDTVDSYTDLGKAEYVAVGYKLQREPLRLHGVHRDWFTSIYSFHCNDNSLPGLVLGAVAWMANLLATHRNVFVVDSSPHMLALLQSELKTRQRSIQLTNAAWDALPKFDEQLGVILGDNSFTFLEFPSGWRRICATLASRTAPGGKLVFRAFSTPSAHEVKSFEQIAMEHAGENAVNWTAVRTKLLFACWDPITYRIETEVVLERYKENEKWFDTLLREAQAPRENDLQTIFKYRNSRAVYYAPPLAHIMEVIQEKFVIQSVHYGSHELAEYFPLIVAARR